MSTGSHLISVPEPRTPLKLIEAVRALEAVRTIDDAKYFSDKADALAAWARIYKDDEAGLEARRVKLHAFRRMGELAEELQPTREKTAETHVNGGRPPGACSLLMRYGFSGPQAARIMQIARSPKTKFKKAVSQGMGTTRAALYGRGTGLRSHGGDHVSDAWTWLTRFARLGTLDSKPAKDVARGLSAGEVVAVRKLIAETTEWLDELDQYLPKPKEKAHAKSAQ